MSESGDTVIKLFGKTITSLFGAKHDDPSASSPLGNETSSSSSSSSCCPSFEADKVKKPAADDNGRDHSSFNEEPRSPSETSSPRSSKNSEITTVTGGASPEKTALKKPDKILPCPRCKSSDTKFCYYNNYNVNQPRHFCKNCQRYWTAGGSMRNVPVGSGRRKNKGWASSSNQYLQIDSDNSNSSATILDFGSSGFAVSDSGKDRAGDAEVAADSASQDVENYHQGFLPPQVTFTVPRPWPYRLNPTIPDGSFYPMPFYWGCTVPLWSPNTSSPCQVKRKRDETSLETDIESKDTEWKRQVSESPRADEKPSEATRSFVMSKLAIRPEKTEQDKLCMMNRLEERKVNERSLLSDTSLALQANPAAFARSLNFRETNATVSDKILNLM